MNVTSWKISKENNVEKSVGNVVVYRKCAEVVQW